MLPACTVPALELFQGIPVLRFSSCSNGSYHPPGCLLAICHFLLDHGLQPPEA